MKNLKNILGLLTIASLMLLFISCEKDTDPKEIKYSVKGLTSEYKVTYFENGENKSEVVTGGENFMHSFKSEKGEILYFDIKYKDDVQKMSNFSTMIAVGGTILRESYAYDFKWADSASQNIPYPFEIILSATVPY